MIRVRVVIGLEIELGNNLSLKKIVVTKSYDDVKECIAFSAVRYPNSCP